MAFSLNLVTNMIYRPFLYSKLLPKHAITGITHLSFFLYACKNMYSQITRKNLECAQATQSQEAHNQHCLFELLSQFKIILCTYVHVAPSQINYVVINVM
jgi:hypothetical protein